MVKIILIPTFPSVGSFLGPEPVKIPTRKIIKVSEIQRKRVGIHQREMGSVGFVPRSILQFPLVPIILPETLSKVFNYSKDVEHITLYRKVDLALINELSSDIKDHFETRLQNDFSLFVQVLKTDLIFSEYQTQHQVGQAKEGEGTYIGAHCSTFPNIVCTRVTKQGAAVQNNTAHMFAYKSSSYFNRNATTIVPTQVNKVDSALEPSIRPIGIAILNELSRANSTLTPKEGFMRYIADISTKLEMLKEKSDDPITHKIISDYLRVSRAYTQFLNNQEDHILRKLCFAYKQQPTVNESFYASVQTQINEPLSSEMHTLKIEYDKIKNDETPLIGKMLDYVRFCFECKDVQDEVRDYFKTTSIEIQEADKKRAHNPILSATKGGDVGFSEKMLGVFNICLTAIQSFNDKKGIKPKKMNVLFPRILKEIMTKPIPAPEILKRIPVIQPTMITRSAAKSKVDELAKTPKDYAKKMMKDEKDGKDSKVKEIAKKYFSTTSIAVQQADLKKVGMLTHRSINVETIGFSPLMYDLYKASLAAVRTPKTPKRVPEKLDEILAAVLHDFKNLILNL